jgi:hypothetical protein
MGIFFKPFCLIATLILLLSSTSIAHSQDPCPQATLYDSQHKVAKAELSRLIAQHNRERTAVSLRRYENQLKLTNSLLQLVDEARKNCSSNSIPSQNPGNSNTGPTEPRPASTIVEGCSQVPQKWDTHWLEYGYLYATKWDFQDSMGSAFKSLGFPRQYVGRYFLDTTVKLKIPSPIIDFPNNTVFTCRGRFLLSPKNMVVQVASQTPLVCQSSMTETYTRELYGLLSVHDLSFLNVGICSIEISQPGSDLFAPPEPVINHYLILKRITCERKAGKGPLEISVYDLRPKCPSGYKKI